LYSIGYASTIIHKLQLFYTEVLGLGLSIIGEIESYYRMCDSCPTIAYVIQAPLLHPSKLIAVKKHPEWVPVRVKSYKSLWSLHYKSLNFYNPTSKLAIFVMRTHIGCANPAPPRLASWEVLVEFARAVDKGILFCQNSITTKHLEILILHNREESI
jgi:hypothetical protein